MQIFQKLLISGKCKVSWYMKDQTSASWRRYNQKGVYYLMSKARWWSILDTLQDEVETPWRKSLCKVVSKGEGSLEDLEQDGSTKSNLWSDAPFMSFTTLSRIVRGGVMLLQSRAVSHDRTVPTDRPTDRKVLRSWKILKWVLGNGQEGYEKGVLMAALTRIPFSGEYPHAKIQVDFCQQKLEAH